MTWMILVLDEKTGLSVWCDIIPRNILNINTVMTNGNDVTDILENKLKSLVIDAGYVSKGLTGAFHISTERPS